MFVLKLGWSRVPELHDPPPVFVSPHMRDYASFLDSWCFTDMRGSNRALTVRDPHKVLGNTDAGAWVKPLLPCGGWGRFVSQLVGSEVDCSFSFVARNSIKNIMRRRLWSVLMGSPTRN